MRALVAAEVDPLARGRDPGEQRLDELVALADEREDGAMMVGVHVDVEQARGLRERAPSDSITASSRPSEKFGTDSSTGRTLGA